MPVDADRERLQLQNVGRHLVVKNGRVRWTGISHPTFLSKVEDALRAGKQVYLVAPWADWSFQHLK
jgi:hypothetical protein